MKHYIDLKEKPFFPSLIKYMSSGPVVAMVRDSAAKTKVLLSFSDPFSVNQAEMSLF